MIHHHALVWLLNVYSWVQNVPADGGWYLTMLGEPIVGTALYAVV